MQTAINLPPTAVDPQMLETARALAERLEHGDTEGAEQLLDELTRMRESALFQQMGQITRQLHEALTNIHVDTRLPELLEQSMPDARERLNFVITKTDEAAHRTLSAVESALPVARELEEGAARIRARWQSFRDRDMDVTEYREFAPQLDEFLGTVAEGSHQLSTRLSDILMAQDFQDITGQIIRQVIKLVQEVDEELVGMIRVLGTRAGPSPAAPLRNTMLRGEGPQMDTGSPEVVSSQDDVDDLLSSLGF